MHPKTWISVIAEALEKSHLSGPGVADIFIEIFDRKFEEFGFYKIASWRTPSWIDVNSELMNNYYTNSLIDKVTLRQHLSKLRTANNFWYVYSIRSTSKEITTALKSQIQKEEKDDLFLRERFDFEVILDECGFGYHEKLSSLLSTEKHLWKVQFH